MSYATPLSGCYNFPEMQPSASNPEKPVLVYDGNCRFCCFWVARWQRVTEGRIEYLPSREARKRYPEVPEARFDEAVQLLLPQGDWLSGGDAVLALLERGRSPWPQIARGVRAIPGGRWVVAWGYRRVANHRAFLWRVTKVFWKP